MRIADRSDQLSYGRGSGGCASDLFAYEHKVALRSAIQVALRSAIKVALRSAKK